MVRRREQGRRLGGGSRGEDGGGDWEMVRRREQGRRMEETANN